MERNIGFKERRYIEELRILTRSTALDCVIDDRFDRVIYVIKPGDMGLAIGRGGSSIKKASDVMGKRIEVVEYSPDPGQFIRNCFLPAHVTDIDFATDVDDQPIARVEVRDEDRGLAIGKAGKNIFKAKVLAQRQHDIVDVQLMQNEVA